jgi:hypothetical protein
MSATAFWLLHAGLVGAAGIVMLLFGLAFGRILAPGEPAAASA